MKIIQQTDVQVAEVRKQQKATHYTVTTIGGPEERAKWKADQAIREAEYQRVAAVAREQLKNNAVEIVMGDRQPAGSTELELAEQAYLKRRKAQEEAEKAGNPPVQESKDYLPKHEEDQEKPSFIGFCAKIWRNAFDSERD